MFTGIVAETGKVVRIKPGKRSTELRIQSRQVARGVKCGDSVAVNGACLTVVAKRGLELRFDVLTETIRRTSFGDCRADSPVNLARPVAVNGRLDGHIVQGHVDGVGRVRRWEKVGQDFALEVVVPRPLLKYIVEKGSIAVDGISLTVAAVGRNWFRVWIIPHTRKITNLHHRRVGDRVNLEVDVVAKYVERMLRHR
jgi:riboflavin synthase